MSRMSVSMGVLPTKRTKKSCSMTDDETVRSEGSRRSSLPKRLGWLGYWLRTYSSRAHCDFSCRLSMCAASDRPQASAPPGGRQEGDTVSRREGGRTDGRTDGAPLLSQPPPRPAAAGPGAPSPSCRRRHPLCGFLLLHHLANKSRPRSHLLPPAADLGAASRKGPPASAARESRFPLLACGGHNPSPPPS